MICPYCDQPADETADNCARCGARLATRQPSKKSVASSAANHKWSQQPKPTPTRDTSAYAVLQPAAGPKHAVSLLLAVAAIPAAVMPLLGLALAIPALILARKHRVIIPLVLALLGIALSLTVLVFNIVYEIQHKDTPAVSAASTTNVTWTV